MMTPIIENANKGPFFIRGYRNSLITGCEGATVNGAVLEYIILNP